MNKRILVIEDDPATLRLITYTLQQENYQVLTATNGLAGIRKAQKENPDLILLDVMLPGIDGFEICHRLKTEAQTTGLPILLISAKAQETDKTAGLKAGADDYISKPWERSELTARIADILSQKNTAA